MKKITSEYQLTFPAPAVTIGGGAEGDVRVARRSVVPFPCHCPAGSIAEVQLHFCGIFKSCQGPTLDRIAAL